jgi:membrane-bound serine protease (ClpP class)
MELTVVLLIIAAILLVLEIILPGGVIGLLGLLCLLAALVSAFVYSLQFGLSVTLGVLLTAPVALWGWIHYFPRSRFAKPLTLEENTADWRGDSGKNDRWLNAVGRATSDLRPSGIVSIDGKRLDVVSDGRLIDSGTMVRVVAVQGNRIIVAPEDSAQTAASQAESST